MTGRRSLSLLALAALLASCARSATPPGPLPVAAPPRAADADHDGTLDALDACPTAPEDRDAFEDEDGCPETDNDGDRVADVYDRCPMDPETRNGVEDEDGCPDTGPVVAAPLTVALEDPLHDNGSVRTPSLQEAVSVIADLLRREDAIGLVVVEGHAARAHGRHAMAMSAAVADGVLAMLVEQGVARQRLRAVGLGDLCPTGAAPTPEGALRDDRVRFTVVLREGQRTPALVGCPAAQRALPYGLRAPAAAP